MTDTTNERTKDMDGSQLPPEDAEYIDLSEIRPAGDAWSDLIAALTLLRKGARSSARSPLHCEHDTLWVGADPEKFTAGEIAQLEEWGFHPDDEDGFYSYRFGSA